MIYTRPVSSFDMYRLTIATYINACTYQMIVQYLSLEVLIEVMGTYITHLKLKDIYIVYTQM